MKRILIYIVILAALLVLPQKRVDVSKLIPVQTVSIYKEEDWVVIQTDTDHHGIGATARQALQNLKDTAAGILYLDTAEYLLLTKDTVEAAEELRQELKPSVRLCLTTKQVDLTEVAKFLRVHGVLPKLKHWKTSQELPVLSTFRNSLIFLKKVEKRA